MNLVIKIGIFILVIIGLIFFFWPGYPPHNFLTSLITQKFPKPEQTSKVSKNTLDSHQMPELLNIEIKNNVDKDDGEKMREGFKVMDFYLNEWMGKSITKKSAVRVEATSGDSKFLDEGGTIVFLYLTQSKDWQLPIQIGGQYNMDMRSRAAAHEYVHLYQINSGCAHLGRAAEKAKWFLEGEAEWLSYKAMLESGIMPAFLGLEQMLSIPLQGGNLKPLKMYEKEVELDVQLYSYFALAVNLLMKDKEIKTLDRYCANIGQGIEPSVAFEDAFSTPLEKFYSDFADYYQKFVN